MDNKLQTDVSDRRSVEKVHSSSQGERLKQFRFESSLFHVVLPRATKCSESLRKSIEKSSHCFIKGKVQHFGEYTYSLSCRELDDKFCTISYLYGKYGAGSLDQNKDRDRTCQTLTNAKPNIFSFYLVTILAHNHLFCLKKKSKK